MTRHDSVSVLHIVDHLGFGGVQTILKGLFELERQNQRIFLLALRRSEQEVSIDHPNVCVYPDHRRFTIGSIRRIVELVRKHRIQIIHCHLFRAQVFGYLAARMLGRGAVKLVFHEHGSAVAMESGGWFERFAFQWFQTLAATRADAHIAISHYAAQSLTHVSQGRVQDPVVIHNPTRKVADASTLTAVNRASARKALGIPAGAFVVGMVARIVRRKGWRDFLAAISLLSEKLPLFFLIAGDGPEFHEMKAELVLRNLEQRGRVLGYLENTEPVYRALDCFVMPSHWEAAGLAHIEAQSFAIPVVACNVSGLNETVHENVDCLLCRPADPEDMAEKIERLMTDRDLRDRISVAGRQNAEQCSIENYVERLDTLYRRLLGKPSGASLYAH